MSPNITGLTKKEATSLLKGFSALYSGTGDTILYQEPVADIYIKENATIKLMLWKKYYHKVDA